MAAASLLGACVPGGPLAVFTLRSVPNLNLTLLPTPFPFPFPFTSLARAADLAPDSAPAPTDAPWQPGNPLAVTLPTPAGTRTLTGTLRADALDGSLLLELADQRLENVETLIERRAIDDERGRDADDLASDGVQHQALRERHLRHLNRLALEQTPPRNHCRHTSRIRQCLAKRRLG
jgi:hypothetical protein